ncbi:Predicted hydrolase (HAD superfamily) [Ceraceosorus bombacis]|uniref:Predicted hydrolase (HAD superfamily) n=1 Tax=Ceraceosorus bombacis TaxID=401625 RepID=A0A0P1BFU0_9BASI|nr:Predicted hydrolase (HAD superfamily) [Ceraceosorus bombacis]
MGDGNENNPFLRAMVPPRAIIFDIGGVVVGSPLVGINLYEQERGLPHDYINVGITARGRKGAFQRFERSELALYAFYKTFGEELSDLNSMNRWYTEFCKARRREVPQLPTDLQIDGRHLFGLMMKQSTRIDPLMETALKRLRASGKFRLAALTNNFAPPTAASPENGGGESAKVATLEEELEHLGISKESQRIRDFFDEYIESAVVGMRKPEEGIYLYALDKLKVRPDEVVFLDDIGHNLKAAAKLGIRTIRVSAASCLQALRQLEQETGIELLDERQVEYEKERVREAEMAKNARKPKL